MGSAVQPRGMVLIEGVLSEVHVELGSENLLARVDKHYQGGAVLTGAAAIAGDLFGQASAAASLAMYDGEDTQNFLCLLDGQVVCGQFAGAEWLKNGHAVKAVVERREGVLVARGILDDVAGLLWVGHPWGAKAEQRANWRIAAWSYLFMLLCWTVAHFVTDGDMGYLQSIGIGAVCGAVVCAGVALWANRDMRTLADPATEVFRLLGFLEPGGVNLNDYRISALAYADHLKDVNAPEPEAFGKSSFQTRDVYCYQRAIKDGRLAMAS